MTKEGTVHELKTWPMFFEHVLKGIKKFELRSEHDRCFRVGDILLLKEYERSKMLYTGREIRKEIIYILRSHEGLKMDYAILGLR